MTTTAITTRKARGRGPLSVTAQQSLVHYLALDNQRSLRQLRRYYEENDTEYPPSFAILAVWSRQFGWSRAALAYDESVGAALLLRLHETSVQQRFDQVGALNNLAQRCLDTANEIAIDATAATVSDLCGLVSTAIDALKMVEVLTGGVTDRQDRSAGIAEEAMVLLRAIEEDKRQRR
jgi:hypothetical protein